MKKYVLSLMCGLCASFAWSDSAYDDCLAEYGTINNSIVAECSERSANQTEQGIDGVLAQIRQQALQNNDAEKYQKILKAHQLWEKYMQAECDNAGAYIGSPMYEYCPMEKTAEQLERLKQYLD